ncbi:MAG: hypothetical protein WC613_00985 [Candidatus Aenigmatarchaeota archaeon]
MKEDIILKELRNILNVSNEDIPKTLSRFKREIEEMKKEIK